jgi:hypothetical protein
MHMVFPCLCGLTAVMRWTLCLAMHHLLLNMINFIWPIDGRGVDRVNRDTYGALPMCHTQQLAATRPPPCLPHASWHDGVRRMASRAKDSEVKFIGITCAAAASSP